MQKGLFLAGADPELMLVDAAGTLISAIGRIKGTKKRPLRVECGAIQRDNVLAEFNIDPAKDDLEMIGNIRRVLQQLAEHAAPNFLLPQAGADYPGKALKNKAARIFGCDPDFNAWPNEDGMITRNLIPPDAATLPFRSAGGHLHIGYTDKSKKMLTNDYGRIAVIQLLDVFCGMFGVIVDDDATNVVRRKLYGKAGAHRPKPYGVEYRSLSNFWIRSPLLVSMVTELAEIAVEAVLNKETELIINSVGGSSNVQSIINSNKVDEALELFCGPLSGYLPEDVAVAVRAMEPMQFLAPHSFYQTWELQGV